MLEVGSRRGSAPSTSRVWYFLWPPRVSNDNPSVTNFGIGGNVGIVRSVDSLALAFKGRSTPVTTGHLGRPAHTLPSWSTCTLAPLLDCDIRVMVETSVLTSYAPTTVAPILVSCDPCHESHTLRMSFSLAATLSSIVLVNLSVNFWIASVASFACMWGREGRVKGSGGQGVQRTP